MLSRLRRRHRQPIAGPARCPTPAPTPNGKQFTAPPKSTIDNNKIYVATFDTSLRRRQDANGPEGIADDGQQLRVPRAGGLLRRHQVPSRAERPRQTTRSSRAETRRAMGPAGPATTTTAKRRFRPRNTFAVSWRWPTRAAVSSNGSQFFFVAPRPGPSLPPSYTVLGNPIATPTPSPRSIWMISSRRARSCRVGSERRRTRRSTSTRSRSKR